MNWKNYFGKLQEGSQVVIRSDLTERTYNRLNTNDLMVELRGEPATIVSVREHNLYGTLFSLDIDNGHWAWNELMFEGSDWRNDIND